MDLVIGYAVVITKVLVGLGFVIFVHELGHFAVAKLCGVKCEKFYLGFDIAGLKLCKFRWGETEYGIGILPLGGYVKMLGQEDNPAKLREEMERAKQKAEGGSGKGDEQQGLGTSVPSEFPPDSTEPLAPYVASSTNAQQRPRPLTNAVSSESRSRLSAAPPATRRSTITCGARVDRESAV